MRMLVVLKTKKFAVADSHVYYSDSGVDTYGLATRGAISVPRENVDYVLTYDDRDIETFRQKRQLLRDNDEYEAI